MTRMRSGLALLIAAVYAPGSPAQEDDFASAAAPERRLPSDWSFEFGGGALAVPSYAGASSTKIIPLPWIDVHYKNLFFLSPISGLGVNLVAVPEGRLAVALLPDLGRSASSNNLLRGWGDIGAGADLRLSGQLHLFGPISALAGVRRQLGGGNGNRRRLCRSVRCFPRFPPAPGSGTSRWRWPPSSASITIGPSNPFSGRRSCSAMRPTARSPNNASSFRSAASSRTGFEPRPGQGDDQRLLILFVKVPPVSRRLRAPVGVRWAGGR